MSIPILSYGFGVLVLLCCLGVSLSTSQNNGFSVELIHRDSSRSPLYNPKEIKFQGISNIVHHSINRAKYVNQLFYASDTNSAVSNLTPYLGVGHIMSYAIGSPPFQMYGYLDMLIDMIWFQCKPCNPCLNLTSPIFDPSKSSTYYNIPCGLSQCYYVPSVDCNISDNCKYRLLKNSSYSQGDLSFETFTLNSTSGSPISFPGIVIGCEHKNGEGFPLEGKVSGTIGLGGGPLSLTSQLNSSIGGKFSYCLVPFFSNSNATSSILNFGDAAVVSGPQTVSTPIKQINPILVTLQEFIVGNETIPSEIPAFGPITSRNTIIDIGTSITILPEKVYLQLESIVADLIKLPRVNSPILKLNLCYQSTIEELEVPIITAHFMDAYLQLKAHNTFIQVDDKIVCFAFTTFGYYGGPIIFGNIAQHNFLVGFDFQKKIVSFKPVDCTNQ